MELYTIVVVKPFRHWLDEIPDKTVYAGQSKEHGDMMVPKCCYLWLPNFTPETTGCVSAVHQMLYGYDMRNLASRQKLRESSIIIFSYNVHSLHLLCCLCNSQNQAHFSGENVLWYSLPFLRSQTKQPARQTHTHGISKLLCRSKSLGH